MTRLVLVVGAAFACTLAYAAPPPPLFPGDLFGGIAQSPLDAIEENVGTFLASRVDAGTETLKLDMKEMEGMKGFDGGFTAKGFGFLVPNGRPNAFFGKVVRVGRSLSNAVVLDVSEKDEDCKGFTGGFADAEYGYLVPGFNGDDMFGKITRFDLGTFSQVTVLDATKTDPRLKGFDGGFKDLKYGYLVPDQTDEEIYSGVVARFDLATFSKIEILDLPQAVPSLGMNLTGFSGGFQDGTYGYLVPNANADGPSSILVRFDLATFKDVTVKNLTEIDPDLKGFSGGFTTEGDGTGPKYGILVPGEDSKASKGTKVVRFDLSSFADFRVLDLQAVDKDFKSFHGGFAKQFSLEDYRNAGIDQQTGSHIWLMPFDDGKGKVARMDVERFDESAVIVLEIPDADKGFNGGFVLDNSAILVPADGEYKVVRINSLIDIPDNKPVPTTTTLGPTTTTAAGLTTTTAPAEGGINWLMIIGIFIGLLVVVVCGVAMYKQSQAPGGGGDGGRATAGESEMPDRGV